MKNAHRRRAQLSLSGGPRLLTAKEFLGKEGTTPYVTPEQLFEFNDNSRQEDVDEAGRFIDLGKQYGIVSCKNPRLDKGGNRYAYPVFNRNGNTDGVKVVEFGNIFQFIQDLYDRKFAIGFTYDDLIVEAEQS